MPGAWRPCVGCAQRWHPHLTAPHHAPDTHHICIRHASDTHQTHTRHSPLTRHALDTHWTCIGHTSDMQSSPTHFLLPAFLPGRHRPMWWGPQCLCGGGGLSGNGDAVSRRGGQVNPEAWVALKLLQLPDKPAAGVCANGGCPFHSLAAWLLVPVVLRFLHGERSLIYAF